MTTDSMAMESDATLFLGEAWFDPIEAGIREQIRGFIDGLIEEELTVALGRRRYERGSGQTTVQRDRPRRCHLGRRQHRRRRRVTGTVIASASSASGG